MDALFIGVVIAFFALTWGLMVMCDRLGGGEKGGKQ